MTEQQNTLRIAVRKFGPFETALEKIWAAYCRHSGCTLAVELVPMELLDLFGETLQEGGLANGRWDIAHINTDWVYEGYKKGAFADLKPFIDQNAPQGFPHAWSSSLMDLQQFGAHISGLPFHNGPECLIYRKDLFEDPQEQQHYFEHYGTPLQVPRTWEEFRRVAQFFHRPAQQLYGTVFAGFPDGHNTVFDFCLQLWSRGGQLTNAAGELNIDCQEAVEALDFYRNMMTDQGAVHPNAATYGSVEAGKAFARGEVALMVNWFGFAAVCETDLEHHLKNKVGVAEIPANPGNAPVSLNVYWLYTIGSGSRHKQLAYDFIRFATNVENDQLLTLEGGIGCRLSTWKDPEVNRIIPFYHQLQQLHTGAASLPQNSNWVATGAIIDKLVREALYTATPSQTLIKKANTAIQQLNR